MMISIAAFGFVVLLVLSFAHPHEMAARPEAAAAGALWVALLFASQLGILRAIEVERTGGRLETIRSTPVDMTWLFLAKTLSIFTFIAASAAVLLIPFTVLFNLSPVRVLAAVPPLLLGLLGISVTGTLVAFLAAGSRLREIVMPILFMTLFVPLLLACISATEAALRGIAGGVGYPVLIGFDLVIGGASILLAPTVLEE
jgi:heme exporter protein B